MNEFLNYSIYAGEDINLTVGRVLTAFSIFVLTFMVYKIIRYFVLQRARKKNSEEEIVRYVSMFSFIKFFIVIITFFIALRILGVDLTVALAGSAALFIGLGLGMQQFFMDFISGMIILFDKTIKIDDVIQVEDLIGKVAKISIRTTKIITRDEKVVIIPNHKFLSEYLYNWTQDKRNVRFNVTIGVAYGTDTKLVEKLLIEAADEQKKISQNPRPVALFTDFGDNALVFDLYFFTEYPFLSPGIKSELRFTIDKKFRENNIIIPFPQRDVHMKK